MSSDEALLLALDPHPRVEEGEPLTSPSIGRRVAYAREKLNLMLAVTPLTPGALRGVPANRSLAAPMRDGRSLHEGVLDAASAALQAGDDDLGRQITICAGKALAYESLAKHALRSDRRRIDAVVEELSMELADHEVRWLARSMPVEAPGIAPDRDSDGDPLTGVYSIDLEIQPGVKLPERAITSLVLTDARSPRHDWALPFGTREHEADILGDLRLIDAQLKHALRNW